MKKKLIVSIVLSFVFQLAMAQVVPNGGFENWYNPAGLSFEDPVSWWTSNIIGFPFGWPDQVTKTDDAYKGDFALKLETITEPGTGDPFQGAAVCSAGLEGRPEKFTGYYKASVLGEDLPEIELVLWSGDAFIGDGYFEFETSADEYTYFEFEIEYHMQLDPDSMIITIVTTDDEFSHGTTLTLDDLSFDNVNSTSLLDAPKFITRLSPNPASDQLLVKVPEAEGGVYFSIMDTNGKHLKSVYFISEINIEIAAFPVGNYFYKVVSQEGLLQDGGKFQILR